MNQPLLLSLCTYQLSSVMLVFDLGGGTFDISVVEAGDGVEGASSAGDNHLGGDDFNLHRPLDCGGVPKQSLIFAAMLPPLLSFEWAIAQHANEFKEVSIARELGPRHVSNHSDAGPLKECAATCSIGCPSRQTL
jgi:hypothetical protein